VWGVQCYRQSIAVCVGCAVLQAKHCSVCGGGAVLQAKPPQGGQLHIHLMLHSLYNSKGQGAEHSQGEDAHLPPSWFKQRSTSAILKPEPLWHSKWCFIMKVHSAALVQRSQHIEYLAVHNYYTRRCNALQGGVLLCAHTLLA